MANLQSGTTSDGAVDAVMGMMGLSEKRKERKEGDVSAPHDHDVAQTLRLIRIQIGSVFASLSGEAEVELPNRFLELKR